MILSRSKKFLFIHLPRTGGSSLRDHLLKGVKNDGEVFWQHTSLEYFQRKSGLALSDYFKFAFVRNPWDRLASLYSLFKLYDQDDRYGTFEEMLVKTVVKRQETRKLHQIVVNQLELLSDTDGNVNMDFIGKFENYQRDVKNVLNHIDISPDGLEHLNAASNVHYSNFHTPETRAIIAEYCRPDIEYFNYTFESPTAKTLGTD